MEHIFSFILGAVLVEALVSSVSLLFQPLANKQAPDYKYVIALVLGIVFAVVYGIDAMAIMGLDTAVPYIGMVFTGIILARGSNYAYDLLSTVLAYKEKVASM